MDKYTWTLTNKDKAEISFSRNFDNLIRKYRNGKTIESVFLMDCGIVNYMPRIMRYCFEEDVNLRNRSFLSNLNNSDFCEINKDHVKQYLQIPLMSDMGLVRSLLGDLVIYSSPSNLMDGKISFKKDDVPRFVEGILKVLDNQGIILAFERCSQTIQYYYQCLDEGILKHTKK
jgi:hypothetical protein